MRIRLSPRVRAAADVSLQSKIIAGLCAGAVAGWVARHVDAIAWAVTALEPFGTIFIRLISMVVVPLVIASLFTGVASLGDARRLGRIGGRTLVYFLATTILGAIIGTAVALAAGAGAGLDPSVRDAIANRFESTGKTAQSNVGAVPGLMQTLIAIVPQNPIAAAAQGDLLATIFAVLVFGAAATTLDAARRQPLVTFFEAVNDVAMVVIRWLMVLAPAAVFLLIAATVLRSGADLLRSLAAYALIVVAGACHSCRDRARACVDRGARGSGLRQFCRAVADPLLLAFSTSSSSVTLPVSMAAARDRLGRLQRNRELRAADGHDAQQERRRRLQGGHRRVPGKSLRRAADARNHPDDRAHDGGRVIGRRRRSGQLARDHPDRAQRDRSWTRMRRRASRSSPASIGRSTCAERRSIRSVTSSVPSWWRGRSVRRPSFTRHDDDADRRSAKRSCPATSGRTLYAGDIAICSVDLVVGTDGSGPMAIDYFEQMGGSALVRPVARVLLSGSLRAAEHTADTRVSRSHSRVRRPARCDRVRGRRGDQPSNRGRTRTDRRGRAHGRRRQPRRDLRRAELFRDRRRVVRSRSRDDDRQDLAARAGHDSNHADRQPSA